MRLIRVELTRYRCRRAIALLLLAVALLGGLLVFTASYSTRPPNATESEVARSALASSLQQVANDRVACVADPENYLGPGALASDCAEGIIDPQLPEFLPRGLLRLGDILDGQGVLLVVLLAGVALLIGATFSGADWASGSLSNQLIFRPRRLSVWLAKAVAVVTLTTVAAAGILAAFWAALGAVVVSRSMSTPPAVWENVLVSAGRGLVLVAATALGGFALTMLLRRTVATMGLLFVYAVAGEGLAASLPVDRMGQWSLSNNLQAWTRNGIEIYDPRLCGLNSAADCSPYYQLPASHAAWYLGVLLVIAVLVSLVAFRARDVD